MNISESQEGPIAVIHVEGRLDNEGAGKFQEYAARRIKEGARSIVVDFGGTSFMASMGIRALMLPAQDMSRAGGRFALTGLSEQLHKLFETAHLYKIFQVYPSVADAAADGTWA